MKETEIKLPVIESAPIWTNVETNNAQISTGQNQGIVTPPARVRWWVLWTSTTPVWTVSIDINWKTYNILYA